MVRYKDVINFHFTHNVSITIRMNQAELVIVHASSVVGTDRAVYNDVS